MKIIILFFLIKIFIVFSDEDIISLEINRSKRHEDQTGKLTPLVVSVISKDIDKKVKGVDLICVVDISGSMWGDKLNLVKESLKYLVNLMDEKDNFALVTFSTYSEIYIGLTQMTEGNKTEIIKDIDLLYDDDMTNIYAGLEDGLSLINKNYTSGDQIASMILLSDGWDTENAGQVENLFKNLLEDTNKRDYAFTLHTFGYGKDHDSTLMVNLANIKEGGYFAIEKLADVNDAYLKIYGALSTVCMVNLQLIVQSNFFISKIYGIEDMTDANLKNISSHYFTFNTKLTHVVFGKRYEFTALVDVPENTPIGTEILNATISPLGLTSKYLLDNNNNKFAYEEYIKCICVTYFSEGYNQGLPNVRVINEGLTWIQENYQGERNWEAEFNGIIEDLNDFNGYGQANILSKIRELKTNKIGINYKNENSYQKKLIDESHNLDITQYPLKRVTGEEIINIIEKVSYYYFYLKEGEGEINNIYFSGNSSIFVVYSNDINSTINIKSISPYMEFYYFNETRNRIQTIVDFSKPGKFIYKKDFPFQFYSRVDGRSDVTFNIEFLKLDSDKSENSNNLFIIKAYIVDDNEADLLKNDPNILPKTSSIFEGNYDDKLKIGKVVILKDKIYKALDPNAYNNYLYVIIEKDLTSNINYNNVEGKFLFVSMDSSIIPENYTIYSDYEPEERTPHFYTIEMDTDKDVLIEFWTSGKELDCKVLKYQNDLAGVDKYNDYKNFNIERNLINEKIYINVIQPNDENDPIDSIILSIFSKNENHIASNITSELSYTIKYNSSLSNKTNEANQTVIYNDADSILLGFANYVYIKEIKNFHFLIYFVNIREKIYAEILVISTKIRYIQGLRYLEDNKKVECKLEDYEFENQKRYNCSVDTNGEEIQNIEIDDNFEFQDQKIKILSKSSLATKFMDNLQNVGDKDPFKNKKLYILNDSILIVDTENNEFNITGKINNKDFNYEKINLTISLYDNSNEKTKNIPCEVIKINDEDINLLCTSKEKLNGKIDGSFSDLGDNNLIINLKEGQNEDINFTSNKIEENYYIKKSNGISTGGIIAIIIPSILVLIMATVITVLKCSPKSSNAQISDISNSQIQSSQNINKNNTTNPSVSN